MKIIKNCRYCNHEFKCNHSSNLVHCSICRKNKDRHRELWDKTNRDIIDDLNSRLKLIKVVRSGGGMSIKLKPNRFSLANSREKLTNKFFYEQYLFDIHLYLLQDLETIHKHQFKK